MSFFCNIGFTSKIPTTGLIIGQAISGIISYNVSGIEAAAYSMGYGGASGHFVAGTFSTIIFRTTNPICGVAGGICGGVFGAIASTSMQKVFEMKRNAKEEKHRENVKD